MVAGGLGPHSSCESEPDVKCPRLKTNHLLLGLADLLSYETKGLWAGLPLTLLGLGLSFLGPLILEFPPKLTFLFSGPLASAKPLV